MKTYVADIIPKLQRFSQRLDELTRLTNQHWVVIDETTQAKTVYIFRENGELLISTNGIVSKAKWEYLGHNSLLIEHKEGSYLFKQGFFDDNVIALKLDSTNSYAFFVNETKYHKDLNKIEDVLKFLETKYLNNNSPIQLGSATGLRNKRQDFKFEYIILKETKEYYITWGKHTKYVIEFINGFVANLYRGKNSGQYFYLHQTFGQMYFQNFDDAVYKLFLYVHNIKDDIQEK